MSSFKVEVDADGIALVTWDMPERSMNVITMDVIAELGGIVDKVANDAAIKGAVITSGKSTFCGGADLTMLERMRGIYADMVRKQGEEGLREFAYPHSFTAKTGPAHFPVTTFGRPAGALAGALAAVRDRILAEGEEKTG